MINGNREKRRSESTRHQSQIPRLVEAAFYLVIAVSFGVGFIWYNEGPPMVVVERHLLTPEVKIGNQVTILNQVVATKQCPVEIHRSIIDSAGIVYVLVPEVVWPEGEVGEFNYTSKVTVPKSATIGTAVYRVKAEWMCNPLQWVLTPEISLSDIEVEIVQW